MDTIEKVANVLRLSVGGYIFLVGNGAGAALSSHFACDLMKSAGLRAVDLTSNNAVLTAFANDYGYKNVFSEQLKVLANAGDYLIAISASGNSESIVNAVQWANENNLETISLTGYGGGILAGMTHYNISVDSYDMQEVENEFVKIAHSLARMAKW